MSDERVSLSHRSHMKGLKNVKVDIVREQYETLKLERALAKLKTPASNLKRRVGALAFLQLSIHFYIFIIAVLSTYQVGWSWRFSNTQAYFSLSVLLWYKVSTGFICALFGIITWCNHWIVSDMRVSTKSLRLGFLKFYLLLSWIQWIFAIWILWASYQVLGSTVDTEEEQDNETSNSNEFETEETYNILIHRYFALSLLGNILSAFITPSFTIFVVRAWIKYGVRMASNEGEVDGRNYAVNLVGEPAVPVPATTSPSYYNIKTNTKTDEFEMEMYPIVSSSADDFYGTGYNYNKTDRQENIVEIETKNNAAPIDEGGIIISDPISTYNNEYYVADESQYYPPTGAIYQNPDNIEYMGEFNTPDLYYNQQLLNSGQFETLWDSLTSAGEFSTQVVSCPSSYELEGHMTFNGFQTVASGLVNEYQQVYFYSKCKYQGHIVFFLGKLDYTPPQDYSTNEINNVLELSSTFKCEAVNLTPIFVSNLQLGSIFVTA